MAGLDGIEWGGDVHVPPGSLALAQEVGALTRSVGLEVASYGSYYRLDGSGFEEVLATAHALGAPNIRVWAGRVGSSSASPSDWDAAVLDGQRIAALAAPLQISFEFHQGTLADTASSTLSLLSRIDAPNVRTYWQPSAGLSVADRMAEIGELEPFLSSMHVFQWSDGLRLSLSSGFAEWTQYLRGDWALLEFVRDDSPEQFLEDAATLKELLGG